MQSRFEVYEDKENLWRWRHLAANGELIADSGEGYASKQNAERARDRVIELTAQEWEESKKPFSDYDGGILDGGFGRQ